MIGSNVARALAAHDLKVSVYDRQDHRNLRAFIDGSTSTKSENFSRTPILFFRQLETGDILRRNRRNEGSSDFG